MLFLILVLPILSRAQSPCGSDFEGLDLPITPPVYAPVDAPPPNYQPLPDFLPPLPDPTEDPSDEPPVTFFGHEIIKEGQSVIFVIDGSGSMFAPANGPYKDLDGSEVYPTPAGREGGRWVLSGTRFGQARVELTKAIRALSPRTKFGVVVYECNPHAWEIGGRRDGSTTVNLYEATDENKQLAEAWVNNTDNQGYNIQGGGLTGTPWGLLLAFNSVPTYADKIVLLTDGGNPNCSFLNSGRWEEQAAAIDNENKHRTPIDVFGLSQSAEDIKFCQKVAGDSGASYIQL